MVSDRENANRLMSAIVREINARFRRLIPRIRRDIVKILEEIYVDSPEYLEFNSNNSELAAEFGIPKGNVGRILDSIFATLAKEITVTFTPFRAVGTGVTGGLTVEAFNANFENLLSLQDGYVDNDGQLLHWLEWLLLRGDSIIIARHQVEFLQASDPRTRFSRSGSAIMIFGTGWRVPPQYSGTERDNWIIRMVTGKLQFIENRITQSLQILLR